MLIYAFRTNETAILIPLREWKGVYLMYFLDTWN